MEDLTKPGAGWKLEVQRLTETGCVPIVAASGRGVGDCLKKGLRISRKVFSNHPEIRELQTVVFQKIAKNTWEERAKSKVFRPGTNEDAKRRLQEHKETKIQLETKSPEDEALEWIHNDAHRQREMQRAFDAGYHACSVELEKPGVTRIPLDHHRKWSALWEHYKAGWKKRQMEELIRAKPILWFYEHSES